MPVPGQCVMFTTEYAITFANGVPFTLLPRVKAVVVADHGQVVDVVPINMPSGALVTSDGPFVRVRNPAILQPVIEIDRVEEQYIEAVRHKWRL